MLSTKNPEIGVPPDNVKVFYTYDTAGRVATKTDPRGVQARYSYDGYSRVTQIQYFNGNVEDTDAKVTFSYDANPYDGSYSLYAAGRLTARRYMSNGYTFTDMYSYTNYGQVTKKKLNVSRVFASGTGQAELEAAWGYDNEGRLTSMTYPRYPNVVQGGYLGGETYNYTYDTMGRLKTMNNAADPYYGLKVSDAQYGPAGELLSITGVVNETRTYNSRLQLTGLNGTTYIYPAMNNGRIASEVNSAETIIYQYDELNRLIKAETASSDWGQSFTYDGFGNLTGKTATKGSAPTGVITVNRANNRLSDYIYDANGNQTSTNTQSLYYDYENRINLAITLSNGTRVNYGYDPDNRRVLATPGTNGDTVYFWGADGKRVGSYWLTVDANAATMQFAAIGTRGYFGGKLVWNESGTVQQDRLGSIPTALGKYYPYGEERGVGGRSFATYERDIPGGLDYAANRYYSSVTGRFMSPDPYVANGGPGDPESWNRYSYVQSDPVNYTDSMGTNRESCFEDECRSGPAINESGDWGFFGNRGPCRGGSEFLPTPFCYVPIIAFVPPPIRRSIPTCGDVVAGLIPPGQEALNTIAVLFGEDSWGFIGTPTLRSATASSGPTITASDVALEEAMMVATMRNLAAAYKQSVEWTIEHNQYGGFRRGYQELQDALDKPVLSTECDHLISTIAALSMGQTLNVPFTQWGAATGRKMNSGDVRIAGTDFFGSISTRGRRRP